MILKDTKIIIVGASWYGHWAKDFWEGLTEIGADAEIIYTNLVGGAQPTGGTPSLRTQIFALAKRFLRRFAPTVVDFVKRRSQSGAERTLLERADNIITSGKKVLVIFVWTPPSETALRELKKRPVALALWQGEPTARDLGWEPLFDYFDHLFCVDDDWMARFAEERNRRRAILLPLATNPRIHRPVPPSNDPKYQADVAFVGFYRPQRADMLSAIKHLDLKIYGYDWEEGFHDFPWMREKYFGTLADEEVNLIFNTAKISIGTLGITQNPGPTTTQRTFDIALAGGFQISGWAALTPKLFGDAVVLFRTKEELANLVKHYLARPDERRDMAERARLIATEGHTYAHRARVILKACGISVND